MAQNRNIKKDVANSGKAVNSRQIMNAGTGSHRLYVHETVKSSEYAYNPTVGKPKGQNKIHRPKP
jgi:hypothetical protein